MLTGCGRFGFGHASIVNDAGIDGGWVSGTCTDGTRNQNEEESDCGGVCPACPLAASCKALLARRPDAPSAVYQLDIDGPQGSLEAFSAYCDMTQEGGGWTLVLKADGNQNTFAYSSALWTNATLLNPTQPDLDATEAKLLSFMSMPFTEMLIGMKQNGVTRWASSVGMTFQGPITGPNGVPSLSAFFVQTPVDTTSIGGPAEAAATRTQWLGLFENGYIQSGCNRWGGNVGSSNPGAWRLRLGVLGDEQTDCASPDSFIGFGFSFGQMGACSGFTFSTTVGNGARCMGAANDRDTRAMGYVFVR